MNNKEIRNINDLHFWDKNPRDIKPEDLERLKKQIVKFGQYKPLLITEEGEVIGGNMRLRAYKELGVTDVWVSVVSPKDDNEKLEYALSDNDRAGYYIKDQLNELRAEFDIDWSEYAVDIKPPVNLDWLNENEIEEDEAPEVAEGEPGSKLGEVYQLGRHRLMVGDSAKIEDVEKLMNGQKADMVFTDPPYSVNYEKKNKEVLKSDSYSHIEGDNLSVDDIAKHLWKPAFDNMAVVSKDGASIYVTMPQGGDQMMMMMMMMINSWKIKHELIWVKPSPVFSMGRLDYDYMHEPIIYGWKKNHEFYGGGEFKKSVWMIGRESDKSHPTMKPVQLMANALKNSSKEGDICIDLFGGSGSTLIACEQTNRICYMMELDPKYCDVIRKRYDNYINNRKLTRNVKP